MWSITDEIYVNFKKSILIPSLVPTGLRDLLVSSDMLLDLRSFFKILPTIFSWLTAKLKISSFFSHIMVNVLDT